MRQVELDGTEVEIGGYSEVVAIMTDRMTHTHGQNDTDGRIDRRRHRQTLRDTDRQTDGAATVKD